VGRKFPDQELFCFEMLNPSIFDSHECVKMLFIILLDGMVNIKGMVGHVSVDHQQIALKHICLIMLIGLKRENTRCYKLLWKKASDPEMVPI